MKNNSFMTRQQYRQLKNRQSSRFDQNDNQKTSRRPVQDFSLREFKIKRLSKRLDKIIAVVIILIIIVYLILIFVNF